VHLIEKWNGIGARQETKDCFELLVTAKEGPEALTKTLQSRQCHCHFGQTNAVTKEDGEDKRLQRN
jgi:hypothetical protein